MSSLGIIVTGGAGFLGSHLCESLLEDGHNVYCVDNFGSGRLENVAHLQTKEGFELIEADIRGSIDLPPADRIYHLASRASPADFTEFPVRIALTNTEGTRNLLDHAVEHGARMVHTSTSEVYGDPEVHPQPESYYGNVNIRGQRGCYDESKRFAETLTVAYSKRYDIDVRTARIFNTYGPRMRPDDGRVVPTFLKQALANENLTIYGDGSQTRSFCYVSDLIDGLRALMRTPDLANEAVNIGKDDERTIRELANLIMEISGSSSDVTFEPLPQDDPKRRCPDLEKARSNLDWDPSIPLEEGLKRTIKYFEETELQ